MAPGPLSFVLDFMRGMCRAFRRGCSVHAPMLGADVDALAQRSPVRALQEETRARSELKCRSCSP
eukprot:3613723-Prymnesium_polylepis.1